MIDHLVFATPTLDATVGELGRLLGVELTPGGQHLGFGTRNFLAGLGDGAYLEVIGPDPDQPEPAEPRPFEVDRLTEPRLITWAARVTGVAAVVERARAVGYDPGPVTAMSRRRADGLLLAWQLTPLTGLGPVPFLIDWGDTPHPSADVVQGVRLVSFTGTHPEPDRVAGPLAALGVSLEVARGEPGLRAVLSAPTGEVVLT